METHRWLAAGLVVLAFVSFPFLLFALGLGWVHRWMEVGLRRAAGFRTETCANVSSSFLLIAFVLKEGIPELTVSEIFPPIPSVPLPFSEAVTIIPRSQIEEPRGIDSAEAALPPPHRAPAAGSITFLQHHLKPPSSTINHV